MSDPYDPGDPGDPQGHDPVTPDPLTRVTPKVTTPLTRVTRMTRDLSDRVTPWIIAVIVIFTLMLLQRVMTPRDPVTPTVTVTPDPVTP
jgi:hypothetical protein